MIMITTLMRKMKRKKKTLAVLSTKFSSVLRIISLSSTYKIRALKNSKNLPNLRTIPSSQITILWSRMKKRILRRITRTRKKRTRILSTKNSSTSLRSTRRQRKIISNPSWKRRKDGLKGLNGSREFLTK